MTHNNVTRPSGLVMIVRDYVASALPQQQQLAVPATSTCPTQPEQNKMSTCQQHLWHCLNTNKAITLVDFYNKLGLALRPLKSRDNHIYVSTLAPLCISDKHDYPDKNVFVWSEQLCSEFKRAFNPIQQTVCQNLAQVEVQNTCNFNR